MSALEIVAIVVISILGLGIIMLWGQTVLLIDKVLNRAEKEKFDMKNETDTIK